jgi:ATP adenylyltransferase
MVAPYRHVGDIAEITSDEIAEIMSMVKTLVTAIRSSLSPDGFNIGFNIGKAAGAGIAEHIHLHIVPRWNGDTNFMPVLSDVHLISEHIETTLAKIKGHLP